MMFLGSISVTKVKKLARVVIPSVMYKNSSKYRVNVTGNSRLSQAFKSAKSCSGGGGNGKMLDPGDISGLLGLDS